MTAPVHVYRLFDASNRLLYVGCTSNLKARLAAHGRDKVWWPDVAHHTADGPYEFKRGRWIEMLAIVGERPLYNVHLNDKARTTPPAGPARNDVADVAWRTGLPAVRVREAMARGEIPTSGATDDDLIAWVKSWPVRVKSA